jgi:HD-GYP domain-containing protein (c-di-GMP phosphodiesterase class II)
MRAGRPYAAAVGHDEALERLVATDHLFDPEAVAVLIATLGVKFSRREALAPIS